MADTDYYSASYVPDPGPDDYVEEVEAYQAHKVAADFAEWHYKRTGEFLDVVYVNALAYDINVEHVPTFSAEWRDPKQA